MIDRDVLALTRSVAEQFRPRPKLSGVEYANTYGYVTGNAASKGKWITRPYQEAWFEAMADPEVFILACMKSARVGWSETVKIGFVQRYTHWEPSKVMVVQPIDNDAQNYSKEDVASLFADNPHLKGLLSESKSRGTATNTILLKVLTNGALIDIVSAKSGKSFRRKERPKIAIEEPAAFDRIPEGCQIKLSIRRTETAWDPKLVIGGTPIFPNDKAHQWFLKGDQQYRYVPCPHCHHYQQLRWEAMIKEGEYRAHFQCENCTEPIGYRSLRWMDANGGWACPLGLDRSQQMLRADGFPHVQSQHIWAAYSYHAGAVWSHLVSEYEDALESMRKGDSDVMQTFHNTVLGIPWEDSIATKLTADGLALRRQNTEAGNGYPVDTVPNGVLAITAGVDVQGGGGTADERLVVTVWGWGRGEEGWHLGHWEIDGDPQQPETLAQLTQVAGTEWRREDGAVLRMALGGIDDGGLSSTEIRNFCRTSGGLWVPMKGRGTPGLPLISKGSAIDVNRKNQADSRRGLLLYIVGYDRSISHLQGRLRNEAPGPGYLHFGQCSTDQFLAEL